MNEAREEILNRIRNQKRRQHTMLPDLSQGSPMGPGPELSRCKGDPDTLIARFIQMAEKAHAIIVRVDQTQAVPLAVAGFAAEWGLPREARIAPDPNLRDMPWLAAGFTVSEGLGEGDTLLGVTQAFAGVAETGTCVLCSSPRTPSTLNLLPDNHVIVLAADQILSSYEACWSAVRRSYPEMLPRTVLWVTGPSLTGDIEQTLQLGAHGPRRLFIAIVG